MALDPNRWTLKTQEAFNAGVDLARTRNNPEVTPEHLLIGMLGQERLFFRRHWFNADFSLRSLSSLNTSGVVALNCAKRDFASSAFPSTEYARARL